MVNGWAPRQPKPLPSATDKSGKKQFLSSVTYNTDLHHPKNDMESI